MFGKCGCCCKSPGGEPAGSESVESVEPKKDSCCCAQQSGQSANSAESASDSAKESEPKDAEIEQK